jgi:hypothetical protein
MALPQASFPQDTYLSIYRKPLTTSRLSQHHKRRSAMDPTSPVSKDTSAKRRKVTAAKATNEGNDFFHLPSTHRSAFRGHGTGFAPDKPSEEIHSPFARARPMLRRSTRGLDIQGNFASSPATACPTGVSLGENRSEFLLDETFFQNANPGTPSTSGLPRGNIERGIRSSLGNSAFRFGVNHENENTFGAHSGPLDSVSESNRVPRVSSGLHNSTRCDRCPNCVSNSYKYNGSLSESELSTNAGPPTPDVSSNGSRLENNDFLIVLGMMIILHCFLLFIHGLVVCLW